MIKIAAIGAIAAAAPAHAGSIVASNTGLTNPVTTITFDEVVLAQNSPVTNQYSAFGVTFSPLVRYSPETGYPNITGNTIGNFDPYVFGPWTINFDSILSGAAFAIASNSSPYTFEALLNGGVIETINAPIISDSSFNNFYGFSGTALDGIRITSDSDDYWLVDNLQLGSAVAAGVPEPSTWAMILLGFGLVGGAMRSAKRRQKLTVTYA